jgi:hypothetical protein
LAGETACGVWHLQKTPANAGWQSFEHTEAGFLQGARQTLPDNTVEPGAVAILNARIEQAHLVGGQAPIGSTAILQNVFYGSALGDDDDAVVTQAPIEHDLGGRFTQTSRDSGDGAAGIAVEDPA